MTLSLAVDFLSLLAYPESEPRRVKSAEAMRAYHQRACKSAGTLDRLGPIMTMQQEENQLNRVKTRLEHRLTAANDCVALSNGHRRIGKQVPLPRDELEDSLRAAAEFALEFDRPVDHERVLRAQTIPGPRLSLNDIAADRGVRYKSDHWRPEVMHLAIVLRSVQLSWNDLDWVPKPWWPFCPETLLLLSSHWTDQALQQAAHVARYLADHEATALRGFKRTEFLFP